MQTTPSSRFQKAAARERERLLRERNRAIEAVRIAEAQVRQAERAVAELDSHLLALDGLTKEPGAPLIASVENGSAESDRQGRHLRGAQIRKTAVRVLAQSVQARAPIHYRAWLSLVEQAGYRIKGKRPDAVFLSQVSRSPVVRGTTKAGIYELDPEASQRLRGQIRRLERELSEVSSLAASASDNRDERTRQRREIEANLRAAERELAEALETLGQAKLLDAA